MNPQFYGGAFGSGSSSLLEDPVVPAISTGSVLKIAAVIAIFMVIFKKI